MGKSRGKGKYRGGKGRGDDDSEEEEIVGGQSSTVGLLPPSDSSSEEESEDEKKAPVAKPDAKPDAKPAAAGGSKSKPSKPSKDDDEDDDESEESSDDEPPMPEYLTQTVPKKKAIVEERDADDIRKDLERLELVRKKREDDRLKRIRDEGWDRYAAVTETNRPPGQGSGPPPDFDK